MKSLYVGTSPPDVFGKESLKGEAILNLHRQRRSIFQPLKIGQPETDDKTSIYPLKKDVP